MRVPGSRTLAAVWLLTSATALAQAPSVKLIPEPRAMRFTDGTFVATAPRILIESANEREDRLAAATLVEELAARGKKAVVAVTPARARALVGAIYLARLPRKGGLRAALAARGFAVAGDLDEEGYVLDIDSHGIVVAAETGAGLFYGAQTLRQLLQLDGQNRVTSPALQIEDHPAMRWRGIHDDISRGPVPTLDYMKQQIRVISEYKLNMYALYLEHIFDYQGQPLIAPKDGALTAGELKELVAYAARYHVTVLPEQQTFGHLHHMLKYEEYADVAEQPNGHVLTPVNPRTYEIIKSFFSELVPLSPGPFVHIGGDETEELGKGQTRQLVEKRGLGKVYLEHLLEVSKILRPYGKRLMFWGDIAVHYPESLHLLPEDMVAVVWDYTPRPSYGALLTPFKNAGMQLFVSPSAHNYRLPWPDFDAAFVNIRNLVRDGQKYQALGMLNTTWDDDGQQLFANNWPAVVFGAACSWQTGESSIERFQANYDWAFYRSEGTTFRDALADLAHIHALHAKAGMGPVDILDIWREIFSSEGANYVKHALPIAHDLRLAAEHALINLYRGRREARAHADTIGVMILVALILDTQGLRVQYANDIAGFYADAYQNPNDSRRVSRDLREISGVNGRLQDLRDVTSRLRAMYSELWLHENRPYLLQNVLAQYDYRLYQLTARINALAAIKDSMMPQGVPLPPPAQLGFVRAP